MQRIRSLFNSLALILFCLPAADAIAPAPEKAVLYSGAYQEAETQTPPAPITSPSTTQPIEIPSPAILSPRPSQAIQGSVPIIVNTAVEGLISVELSFAYSQDATNTWFPLAQGDQAVSNEALILWDTSTISDGVYTLRLIVSQSDGSQNTVVVPSLRVRNYSPIETDTPTPILPTETPPPGDTPIPTSAQTPTQTPIPSSPTPLPRNPAELARQDVFASAGKGALAIAGLFALVILYQTKRSTTKKG